jgi:hypothetical protein
MEEADWSRLVEQLKRGECTPFLGAGACHPTLPTGSYLSKKLAIKYRYPFPDRTDLPRVAQHAAILDDHVTVKQHVCRILSKRGRPNFAKNSEPHALLAKFPLRVYLTTNYDDFMVSALEREGKTPCSAICRWWETIPSDTRRAADDDLEPSVERPIVYHLHGSWMDQPSLVLTEGDYLEFLINLALDQGADNKMFIPTSILTSFSQPLLFIGYSLQDWTFRVIFHSLRRRIPDIQRRRHVSIQLLPPLNKNRDARAQAESYLTSHFKEWKISVFWGTAEEFCAELCTRAKVA